MTEEVVPLPPLAGLVMAALFQARTAREMLHQDVVPHLPPLRRGAAEHVAKQLSAQRILRAELLHDLDALIALVEREAERGTWTGWEADEAHTRGGWTTIWRDERASSLAAAAGELRALRASIAAILDWREAMRLAAHMSESA